MNLRDLIKVFEGLAVTAKDDTRVYFDFCYAFPECGENGAAFVDGEAERSS